MATTTMGLSRNFNIVNTPKQGFSSSSSSFGGERRRTRATTQRGTVSCSSTSSSSYQSSTSTYASDSLGDQYRTLHVQFGASISDVKKAFRQLALQYHPDVCKGNNCKVQFQNINEAYDVVMSNLRGEEEEAADEDHQEPVYGQDYDMWEGDDWMMGWEGAGVRDYANPYVYTA